MACTYGTLRPYVHPGKGKGQDWDCGKLGLPQSDVHFVAGAGAVGAVAAGAAPEKA